jgi:hypothetical protein
LLDARETASGSRHGPARKNAAPGKSRHDIAVANKPVRHQYRNCTAQCASILKVARSDLHAIRYATLESGIYRRIDRAPLKCAMRGKMRRRDARRSRVIRGIALLRNPRLLRVDDYRRLIEQSSSYRVAIFDTTTKCTSLAGGFGLRNRKTQP